jgi:hypothetical protein
MKYDRTKVEGVVPQLISGLYTVRTPTGTDYTLAESVDVRYGQNVPRVGDEMMLSILMKATTSWMPGRKGRYPLSPFYVWKTCLYQLWGITDDRHDVGWGEAF